MAEIVGAPGDREEGSGGNCTQVIRDKRLGDLMLSLRQGCAPRLPIGRSSAALDCKYNYYVYIRCTSVRSRSF